MDTKTDISLRDAFVPGFSGEQAHLQGVRDGRMLETPVELLHCVRGTAGVMGPATPVKYQLG